MIKSDLDLCRQMIRMRARQYPVAHPVWGVGRTFLYSDFVI
jgi:hypothetical protein